MLSKPAQVATWTNAGSPNRQIKMMIAGMYQTLPPINSTDPISQIIEIHNPQLAIVLNQPFNELLVFFDSVSDGAKLPSNPPPLDAVAVVAA